MIVQHGDPILRSTCSRVESFDEELADVVARLRAAMKWSAERGRPAAGLAAPQIGIALRVFVLDCWPDPFVNPELVTHGAGRELAVEGCLSFPAAYVVPVPRWTQIKTRAADLNGVIRSRKHRGFDARCVQHEIDHLDGVLLTHHAQRAAA